MKSAVIVAIAVLVVALLAGWYLRAQREKLPDTSSGNGAVLKREARYEQFLAKLEREFPSKVQLACPEA